MERENIPVNNKPRLIIHSSNTNPTISSHLKRIDEVIGRGPFEANWESLSGYHWGVYSVPAFANEWYPRQMYEEGHPANVHHKKVYGPTSTFGYKDFIPMFQAERFDAGEWADLFQRSGARFVMPVAEHHDGFAMYDSDLSDWCASKMGPRKDVLGLLKGAIEAREMTTSSRTKSSVTSSMWSAKMARCS